ncbi:MAG: metallophosphoesterase [Thermoanaerobaculia bacterium]
MRRLLHVSDVHFGPKHLADRSESLRRLVAERSPDLVVVSGDLTQRAKPHQFLEAREWVDSLDAPAICIPGNHDVPMYRFWERLFSPLGAYRKHFDEELEPTWSDDELFVVGVNSAYNWTVKDGRVHHRRLRLLAQQLAEAPADLCRIAVIHHELVPAPRFGAQKILTNAHAVVETLSRGGVELVLSGHLHQAYATRANSYYPFLDHPVLLVHAGTTTSSRGRGVERDKNTCNWIAIEDDLFRVTQLLWNDAGKTFEPTARFVFPRPVKALGWT